MSDAFMKRFTEYHSNKRFQKIRYQEYGHASHDMTFFSTLSSASSQYLGAPLAPSCSPSRDYVDLGQESMHGEPMDISPAPPRAVQKENEQGGRSITRPLLNDSASLNTKSGTNSGAKRTQRSALPFEWLASTQPLKATKTMDDIMFTQPPSVSVSLASDDAMDLPSPPISATPTVTQFHNLFYTNMSPSRGDEAVSHAEASSSPPSSPSEHKFERINNESTSTNFTKPSLQGLGVPSLANKRLRRPIFSAIECPTESGGTPACPAMGSDGSPSQSLLVAPPLNRRAVSAMLPPTTFDHLSDESSFDGPDMSSPAQAYAKRQQVKTIRRRDGAEDLRPLSGMSPVVQRINAESPSAKFMRAGLPGFGDNETIGKILPCHRVREDGLMRIAPQTLDSLLDGAYNHRIERYFIIDCRFDYEYIGGHIPGAVNINTTQGVEEFLLGASKPKPCVSGDSSKKTVLVFHCEFSAKRAPTFAKHLRSHDRAMNNHLYPKIHYPEVYILEGGYCEYFKHSGERCQPQGYVTMDDPNHAHSRREDLDQFRKVKFGRTKSYAYGDLGSKLAGIAQQQQVKRNTAPAVGSTQLFAAANAARTRRNGLSTLAEIGNITQTDDEETDIGDSPCPPPNKGGLMKAKKLGRAPITRAETFDASRMAVY
ncbi:hypothetical protein F5J12DRAFT_903735 [Pisolithus orientalis]|uniref:uncharacterized protein n=1 Tax=Pisolithus orientalis TaxID=936130 RepID=UPI00222489E8|nr:uncharacterized protein F5J12DRAFT_903735 [Pisolithus orientalis]KAI6028828.1 hypothetical protein F5J12DRAFT_903735 [Pisolithus orientalis]